MHWQKHTSFFLLSFSCFKYKGWRTDAASQGHSAVSFRLHGTKNHVKKSSEHIITAALLVYSKNMKHQNLMWENRLSPSAINKQTHREKANHISRILATSSQQPLTATSWKVKISETTNGYKDGTLHLEDTLDATIQWTKAVFFSLKKTEKWIFKLLEIHQFFLQALWFMIVTRPHCMFDMCHVSKNMYKQGAMLILCFFLFHIKYI